MKKAAIIFWNILTVSMILILLLGIVYFKFLSSFSALLIMGLIITAIYIIPILFDRQKRSKVLMIENLVVNGLFLFVLVFLLVKSPGIPRQFTDKNGDIIENSISEWDKVSVGGIDQWLLIKGENKDNPVILYLSGGYGQPSSYVIANQYPELEKDFTVVYWEQRGSGKSYNENIPDSSFTLNQLTSDINEIVIYLKQKLNKDKLVLMGHSWGTRIGILAGRDYPENFHFILNIGQSVDFDSNLEDKYSQILYKLEQENNQEAIEVLAGIGVPPYKKEEKWENDEYLDLWADYFSGSEYSKNWLVRENKMLLFKCPEYTFNEKITIKALNKLWLVIDEDITTNFFNSAFEFSVPVYFVQGENDLNTTTSQVKKYYDKIIAPDKDLLIIKNTGHDAHFDKTDKFHEFLLSKYEKVKE